METANQDVDAAAAHKPTKRRSGRRSLQISTKHSRLGRMIRRDAIRTRQTLINYRIENRPRVRAKELTLEAYAEAIRDLMDEEKDLLDELHDWESSDEIRRLKLNRSTWIDAAYGRTPEDEEDAAEDTPARSADQPLRESNNLNTL